MSDQKQPLFLVDGRQEINDLGGTTVSKTFSGEYVPSEESDVFDTTLYRESLSTNRQISVPFQLMSITARNEDGENLFVMTQLSPDQTIYMSLPYSIQEFDYTHLPTIHRHDFYELLYVAEGQVYQNIENARHFYPTGSCCLLNPNVRHAEEYSANMRIFFLQIKKEYLEFLLSATRYFNEENTPEFRMLQEFLTSERDSGYQKKEYLDFIPLSLPDQGHDFIHEKLEDLYQVLFQPNQSASFTVSTFIFELLCRLFDIHSYQQTPVRFASTKEEKLFSEIQEYLISHHGRMGRKELQEKFHYSGDYLYKLVRKFTGLSLSDYAQTIALKEAAELLTNTKMSISGIISYLGYSNQTHFYRVFRERYGMSPREYREAHR